MEGDLQKESVCCFIVTSNETQDKAIHHTWYLVVSKSSHFGFLSKACHFKATINIGHFVHNIKRNMT